MKLESAFMINYFNNRILTPELVLRNVQFPLSSFRGSGGGKGGWSKNFV